MQVEVDSQRLKSIVLFSPCTPEQLGALAPAVQLRRHAKGSRIASAGDRATALHVLLAGRAKVVIADGDGREVILGFIGPNDFFGESSLIDEQRLSVTVQALEPCEILSVPRTAFIECFSQNLGAAMALTRALVERLQRADRKIQDFALLDVYERVARVLLDAGHEESGQWAVDPGCEQIAQMVAASREMVSRVLKDLCEKGLISRHKRKIIVLDRESIAARAAAGLPRSPGLAQSYSSPRAGQR